MPNVVISEEELVRTRPQAIRKLLKVIARKPEVACDLAPQLIQGGRVLAAHDGRAANVEYRDWRFATTHRDILCQYFELWQPMKPGRQWSLEKAYLQLFIIDRVSRKQNELLSVHADPNNFDAPPLCDFKRGPHLHVKRLEEPLPHSHFPMTLGYSDRAIESVGELTRVFGLVADLIAVDVLKRFESSKR